MNTRLAALMVLALSTSACFARAKEERACTSPLATWNEPHPHMGPYRAEFHIALDHTGQFYLDGVKRSAPELSKELRQASQIGPPEPVFVLETEMGAPCTRLDEVREIMTRELKCGSGGHCDEGISKVWNAMDWTGPIS